MFKTSIDPGKKSEFVPILKNNGQEPIEIGSFSRVCRLVGHNFYAPELQFCDRLEETDFYVGTQYVSNYVQKIQ